MKVAVVGATGLVGTKMLQVLAERNFNVTELIPVASERSVGKQIEFKDATSLEKTNFLGTTVVSGSAIAKVIAIGNATKLGIIGKSIEGIKDEKTPFEIQINQFVKKMVWVGTLVFIGVWAIHFFYSKNIIESLLKALTLANMANLINSVTLFSSMVVGSYN